MSAKLSFKIGRNSVGDKAKCLIIAEISANHNNNFTTIKKLIKSAKKSGADIVKIQTYTADTITINSKKKILKLKIQIHGVNKNIYGIFIKKLKLQIF